jgi:hypothetical protein
VVVIELQGGVDGGGGQIVDDVDGVDVLSAWASRLQAAAWVCIGEEKGPQLETWAIRA